MLLPLRPRSHDGRVPSIRVWRPQNLPHRSTWERAVVGVNASKNQRHISIRRCVLTTGSMFYEGWDLRFRPTLEISSALFFLTRCRRRISRVNWTSLWRTIRPRTASAWKTSATPSLIVDMPSLGKSAALPPTHRRTPPRIRTEWTSVGEGGAKSDRAESVP